MKHSETSPPSLGAAHSERGVWCRTERPRGDGRVPRALEFVGALRSFERTDLSSRRHRKAAGEGE
jgi:hypothetical protein